MTSCAALQKEHGIPATIREPHGADTEIEVLEGERELEQSKIDEGNTVYRIVNEDPSNLL